MGSWEDGIADIVPDVPKPVLETEEDFRKRIIRAIGVAERLGGYGPQVIYKATPNEVLFVAKALGDFYGYAVAEARQQEKREPGGVGIVEPAPLSAREDAPVTYTDANERFRIKKDAAAGLLGDIGLHYDEADALYARLGHYLSKRDGASLA